MRLSGSGRMYRQPSEMSGICSPGLKQSLKSFFADITSGLLRNVAGSVLGPLLGRVPSFGGGVGGMFTGGFAGGPGAGGMIGGSIRVVVALAVVAQAVSSGRVQLGIFANGQFARGLNGGILGNLGASLRSTFSNPFAAGAFGAGIGSMLGGQSTACNILGAAGGGSCQCGHRRTSYRFDGPAIPLVPWLQSGFRCSFVDLAGQG